ncbi:dihydrolipoyl dehydrogenase [Mycoplasmatota bacterium]|nr:dihydrolipoyl dehydrogenase [Mycoplasmatota bacterium]
MNKDLVIIGAGPGGYEVALKAASLGLNVALIEKDEIGGTCLNHGCIPTKALYKNAEVMHTLKHSDEFGFQDIKYSFDFNTVQTRKDNVVKQLKNNINIMLKKANVEVIKGVATFKDEYTIQVYCEDKEIEIIADHFIIATGSTEKIIPIEGYQLSHVVTSKEMLDINEVPKKLVIIGGGVIGVEMATIFNELGSEVAIYEYFDRLTPMIDKDISSRLKVYLKKLGINITLDALVEKIEETDEGLKVSGQTKKGKPFSEETEYVLMATGRQAFYDRLNLDEINVLYDKKGIVVNEYLQTSIPHIYAVGDVTGGNMLAHVATYQSYKALDHIFNKENNTNFKIVPACVFTFPEIATVGLTEEEAKAQYETVKTNKFMFRANGKALSMGETDGFVKVIAANNCLVGVHIIGPQASSLIQEAVVLVEQKISVKVASEIIHAHPTLTEALLEAIRGLNE